MAFEVFSRQHRPASPYPTVTITGRGDLSLNAPAAELLGRPPYVVLLFDRDQQVIGLQPSDGTDDDGYKLRANLSVGASAFSRWAELPMSMRFPASFADGILQVQIGDGVGVSVTSNRNGTGQG